MPTINGKACVANGRNLLTGTADKIVTGTNAYALLSNETIDDLLTVFQGLEGQTVTISVDYEYQGFVKGSGRNRLGWEIGIIADSTSWEGQWYSPNNDSGSGRISSTFIVPENITGVDEGYGYIQFSGSGTGTLSNLKLEKGSVSTPLTPAPVDKVFSNGRQVYGRNLVTGTSNELTTVTGSGWGGSQGYTASGTYGAGTYYASAYIENTTPVDISIFVNVEGVGWNYNGSSVQAGQSGISSLTFDVLDGQSFASAWVGFASSQTESYTYKYKEMMITRDQSAWTPAPEDVM